MAPLPARLSHLLTVLLLTACGSRAEPQPEPTVEADPVAAVLCPLAEAPSESRTDIASLAERAEQAQKDVLSQAFDPKYRPLTSASFALAGAASSLANIQVQVPEAQDGALASSAPVMTFRRGLSNAQADLAAACNAL